MKNRLDDNTLEVIAETICGAAERYLYEHG